MACDGLPYTLGIKVVETFVYCPECGIDSHHKGTNAAQQHAIETHGGRDVVFCPEFSWVLLVPGPGHIELNMVRAFVKATWNVFWEEMVEVFNFKSLNAKASAYKKVSDHHKGWTLCRIAREAIAKELLVPYVRHQLSLGPDETVSCSGFYKYCLTSVQNPNYAFMCDMVLEMLDTIFLYRAGVRTGSCMALQAYLQRCGQQGTTPCIENLRHMTLS